MKLELSCAIIGFANYRDGKDPGGPGWPDEILVNVDVPGLEGQTLKLVLTSEDQYRDISECLDEKSGRHLRLLVETGPYRH